MKILKYKQINKNSYKIFLEDKEIVLYEDIILKNNILLKKEISDKEITKYLDDNKYYDAYYKAIKYITTRMRCEKEVRTYLDKYYTKDVVEYAIDKLNKEHAIDEKLYITCYIKEQINLKNTGPNKIKKDLINLNLDKNLIDDLLEVFDNKLINNKISKYIEKKLKLNKNKSLYEFKNKMITELYNLGYSKDDIINNLNNITFNEEEIYNKEYEKLKIKYSKKYSGNELEYFIKNKLYQKGFKSE